MCRTWWFITAVCLFTACSSSEQDDPLQDRAPVADIHRLLTEGGAQDQSGPPADDASVEQTLGPIPAIGPILKTSIAGAGERTPNLVSVKRQTLTGVNGEVDALAISPDGRLLAAHQWLAGQVRIWDLQTGKHVRTLLTQSDFHINQLKFSPDARYLMFPDGQKGLAIWDRTSDKVQRHLKGGDFGSFGVSGDGKRAANYVIGGGVNLWDVASGKIEMTIKVSGGQGPVVFSPDGTLLVTNGTLNTIEIVEVASGKMSRSLKTDEGLVQFGFSPDGKWLAEGVSGKVQAHLWDTATWQKVASWRQGSDILDSIQFTADGGSIITIGRATAIWSVDEIRSSPHPQKRDLGYFSAITMARGGLLMATAEKVATEELTLWDLRHDRQMVSLAVPSLSEGLSVASGANRYLTFTTNEAQVRDGRSGTILWSMPSNYGSHNKTTISPDGNTVATAGSDGIELRNVQGGNADVKKSLSPDELRIGNCLAYSPDGSMLAVGHLRGVQVISVTDGKLLKQLDGALQSVTCVAFSPDQKTIAAGDQTAHLTLWNLETGKTKAQVMAQDNFVRTVTFSPDSMLVTTTGGEQDGTLRLWDTRDGKLRNELFGHSKQVSGVTFSSDGRLLISASRDSTLNIWNAAKGTLLTTAKPSGKPIFGFDILSDGNTLVAVCGGRLLRQMSLSVLIAGDRKPIATKQQERSYYAAPGAQIILDSDQFDKLWLSPDGTKAIQAKYDHDNKKSSLTLIDARKGKTLATIPEAKGLLTKIRFSAYENHVIAAAHSGELSLWKLDSNRLQDAGALHESAGDVCFLPNGDFLVGIRAPSGGGSQITVWDPIGKKIRRTIKTDYSVPVEQVACSSDGKMFASLSSHSGIRLWNAQSGKLIRKWDNVKHVADMTFSPDGTLFAVCCDKPPTAIHLWDVSSGKKIIEQRPPRTTCQTLAFSPDGRLLICGTEDRDDRSLAIGGLILFDASTGKEIRRFAQLMRKSLGVEAIGFSADGNWLASQSYRRIHHWRVKNLLNEEWTAALGRLHRAGGIVERNQDGYRVKLTIDGRKGLNALRGIAALGSKVSLDLSQSSSIGPQCADAIAESKNVTSVNLTGAYVSKVALATLKKIDHLTELKLQ